MDNWGFPTKQELEGVYQVNILKIDNYNYSKILICN